MKFGMISKGTELNISTNKLYYIFEMNWTFLDFFNPLIMRYLIWFHFSHFWVWASELYPCQFWHTHPGVDVSGLILHTLCSVPRWHLPQAVCLLQLHQIIMQAAICYRILAATHTSKTTMLPSQVHTNVISPAFDRHGLEKQRTRVWSNSIL